MVAVCEDLQRLGPNAVRPFITDTSHLVCGMAVFMAIIKPKPLLKRKPSSSRDHGCLQPCDRSLGHTFLRVLTSCSTHPAQKRILKMSSFGKRHPGCLCTLSPSPHGPERAGRRRAPACPSSRQPPSCSQNHKGHMTGSASASALPAFMGS